MLKKYPDLGFTVTPSRSRRIKAVRVTDVEFADDIALSTNNVNDAETLMKELERVAATVGLRMNEEKTKYLVQTYRTSIHPIIFSHLVENQLS